jgi:hypothetical protein
MHEPYDSGVRITAFFRAGNRTGPLLRTLDPVSPTLDERPYAAAVQPKAKPGSGTYELVPRGRGRGDRRVNVVESTYCGYP